MAAMVTTMTGPMVGSAASRPLRATIKAMTATATQGTGLVPSTDTSVHGHFHRSRTASAAPMLAPTATIVTSGDSTRKSRSGRSAAIPPKFATKVVTWETTSSMKGTAKPRATPRRIATDPAASMAAQTTELTTASVPRLGPKPTYQVNRPIANAMTVKSTRR